MLYEACMKDAILIKEKNKYGKFSAVIDKTILRFMILFVYPPSNFPGCSSPMLVRINIENLFVSSPDLLGDLLLNSQLCKLESPLPKNFMTSEHGFMS